MTCRRHQPPCDAECLLCLLVEEVREDYLAAVRADDGVAINRAQQLLEQIIRSAA
jgi:hypothetical protein